MAHRPKKKKPAVFKAIRKLKKALGIRRVRRARARSARKPIKSARVKRPPVPFSPRIVLASDIEALSAPPPLSPAFGIDARLPASYGENALTLLVRDPWWIFAYWEITPARAEEVLAQIPHDQRDARVTVLRVYDLSEGSFDAPRSFFDIELRAAADRWYIDTGSPDRAWGAEIGYRLPDGRFWMLVRSNVVRTPRFGFSNVLDEEWMIPDEDFWKLAGSFGPLDFGASSAGVRRRAGEYLWRTTSSEGSSQFSLKAGPAR